MTFRKLSLALFGALILFGCSSSPSYDLSSQSSALSSSSQKEGKLYRLDEYNLVFANQDPSAAG
ncbi:hypothetical protein IM774_01765 [Erysipelotrichaceae bacterium RD49]|nr:hypothetical protein [Erysipelotrichaceae bacterium RD49]